MSFERMGDGFSERMAQHFDVGDSELNAKLLHQEDVLRWKNSGANDPSEPYSGVALLFNGDVENGEERAEWTVVDSYSIEYGGRE